MKYTDDKWDAFWLAHLKRLNILPEGYIYPKDLRPVRDLLRRRMLFVHQRTSQILSLQSMITRNLGIRMSARDLRKLEVNKFDQLTDANQIFTVKNHLKTIEHLYQTIKDIEKLVLSQVKLKKEFTLLQTIPGIGTILALTIRGTEIIIFNDETFELKIDSGAVMLGNQVISTESAVIAVN